MVIMTIKEYIASMRVSEKSLHKRNDIVKVEYHAILCLHNAIREIPVSPFS